MNKVLALLGVVFSAILAALAILEANMVLLAWVALIPLLFSCKTLSPRSSFYYSWFAGFIFFVMIFYWLGKPVFDYGGSFRYLGLGAMALLYIVLGLFWGFFGSWVSKMLKGNDMCPLLAIPALWTALELLRRVIFFSLPLGFLGFSQAPFPVLIQGADIFGALGISFIIVFVNTVIFLMFNGRLLYKRLIIIGSVILLFTVPYTIWRLRTPQETLLQVGLVQGNTPQEEKWSFAHQDIITNTYLELSEKLVPQADLLVWPESAITIVPSSQRQAWSEFLTSLRDLETPVLLGVLNEDDQKTFNSALFIEDGEIKSRYDKLWLVPFGEYIPFPKLLGWINTGFMVNSPGEKLQLFNYGSSVLAAPICYEILNPSLMRRMALDSSIIFNISNEIWFKDTYGLPLLWSVTVLRAVEMRTPVVKVANTGTSGYVNDLGQVKMKFPNDVPCSELVNVTSGGHRSFYARFGDWPLVLFLLISLIISGAIGSGQRRWGEPF